MATTKIWKVESRIDNAINYIKNKEKTKNDCYEFGMDKFENVRDVLMYATNADKTEKQFYVTGINCKVEDAAKEMELVKIIHGKTNGILAFHGEQSFKDGEVTPELAHEIGVKLANEMWGDRFQVVVTTHLNTKHIHNHFVLNSVSFKDGKKYYSNRENTALLRKTSDELCEEYGLSVLEEKTCKSGINFENYYKKSTKESEYIQFAKEDLDYAIKHALSLQQFENILASMGYKYYYRAGKLSIRKEPYKRYIRVERRFGEEYSIDNIKQRILDNPLDNNEKVSLAITIPAKKFIYHGQAKKLKKPKGLMALFRYYCFLLKVYPKKQQQYRMSPQMRREIKRLEQYSAEANMLCKCKLKKLRDVRNYKESKQDELKDLYNERNRLYYKRKVLAEGTDKDAVTEDIIKVTDIIKNIKRELFYCDDIIKRTSKMVEDIKFIEEERWNKQNEKNKVKDKKKVK